MNFNEKVFGKFGSISNFTNFFYRKEDAKRILLENSPCCGLVTRRVPFVKASNGSPVAVSYPFEIFGNVVTNDTEFSTEMETNLGAGYLAYRFNSRIAILKVSQNKAEASLLIENIEITNL